MTSTDTDGLAVGAYLERDDPRDALVGAAAIEPGMRIGTASARRRAQLLALEPTLSIEPLRGNVDTRLRKRASAVSTRSCSPRAGSTGSGSRRRSARGSIPTLMLPEAAQGALALQVRAGEEELVAARRPRRDAARASSRSGCASRRSAPAASRRSPRTTTATMLHALIADEDGAWVERRSGDDPVALAHELVAPRER